MIMMFLMSPLENDEVVKFQAESHIIVFFMCLQSWTWNAQWNPTSISSGFIPSIVPITHSFHTHSSRLHFKRLCKQTGFQNIRTQTSSKFD
jgi:hypothetical protein